jgi:hypothetical protein
VYFEYLFIFPSFFGGEAGSEAARATVGACGRKGARFAGAKTSSGGRGCSAPWRSESHYSARRERRGGVAGRPCVSLPKGVLVRWGGALTDMLVLLASTSAFIP